MRLQQGLSHPAAALELGMTFQRYFYQSLAVTAPGEGQNLRPANPFGPGQFLRRIFFLSFPIINLSLH